MFVHPGESVSEVTRSNVARASVKAGWGGVSLAHLVPYKIITLRDFDGRTFEFSHPKEVLLDTQVGDCLEVKKHILEGCK